jgi:hypothetical protein
MLQTLSRRNSVPLVFTSIVHMAPFVQSTGTSRTSRTSRISRTSRTSRTRTKD